MGNPWVHADKIEKGKIINLSDSMWPVTDWWEKVRFKNKGRNRSS